MFLYEKQGYSGNGFGKAQYTGHIDGYDEGDIRTYIRKWEDAGMGKKENQKSVQRLREALALFVKLAPEERVELLKVIAERVEKK